MRSIHPLALVLAVLLAGCGGGVDDDLKKSDAELERDIPSLSTEELESRMKETSRRIEALGDFTKLDADDNETHTRLVALHMRYGLEHMTRE